MKKYGTMLGKKWKRIFIIIVIVLALLFAAGQVAIRLILRPVSGQFSDQVYIEGQRAFYRNETYELWNRGILKKLPSADMGMGFDLRSYDVSNFDLNNQEMLQNVTYNTTTVWPEQMPEGFDAEKSMEMGKNPGLGIRKLHEEGITGKGVNIAIIDQGLNLDHEEYKDNLMSYELLHSIDKEAQMHGSAVTSIAVGKNCGVAPDAHVYYISSTFGDIGLTGFSIDLNYMADGIDRVLEINKLLPEDERIKVVSISRGFSNEKGAEGTRAAIERAKQAGVFVITTSTEENYDFSLMGLGRNFLDDPDEVNSYIPGNFWKDYYYENPEQYSSDYMLLVPMDARTYAEWTGTEEYEFGASGGLSWSVPWLAGMYALCLQINEDITPEIFTEKAFETGNVNTFIHNGKEYQLGTIINPQSLIRAIQKEK